MLKNNQYNSKFNKGKKTFNRNRRAGGNADDGQWKHDGFQEENSDADDDEMAVDHDHTSRKTSNNKSEDGTEPYIVAITNLHWNVKMGYFLIIIRCQKPT